MEWCSVFQLMNEQLQLCTAVNPVSQVVCGNIQVMWEQDT